MRPTITGEGATMARRPTLRDVSRAADVSTFTASRAMTSGEGVSDTTRDHVRAVAARLGYVPNQSARSLRSGATKTVGILAANTLNPFYAVLVASIEHVLRARGYHGLVMDAVLDGEYQVDREDAFVDDLIRQQVAAVVLTYSIGPANTRRLKDRDIELIFVDCAPPLGHEGLASITSDNRSGGRAVAEHLVEHRYTRPWAYIAFPGSYGARLEREAGFREVAEEHGIDVHVVESGNDAESAHRVTAAYLDGLTEDGSGLPRALFATNELLLMGALRALRDRRLRVPDDVAVVAYDEFLWAELLEPPVTVVDQHIDDLGATAARHLLDALDGDASPTRVRLAADLIVRRSCGCLPDPTT